MNWTEQERRIFDYISLDGAKKIYADPLKVRRDLLKASGGKFDDNWKTWTTLEAINGRPNPEYNPSLVAQAEDLIVAAVRKTFDLATIDPATGAGVPDAYCLRLIESFLMWYEKKSSNTLTTPTVLPYTASLRAPEPYPMTPGLGSVATPNDCGCNPPI